MSKTINITGKQISITASVIIILVLALIYWPFHSVQAGTKGVITRFGKIVRVVDEGLAIVAPWEHIEDLSIRAMRASIDGAEGSTHDTQPVTVSLTVRYAVIQNRIADVYENYSHTGDLSSYVDTATQDVFKAVVANYTAPELIEKRAKVALDIRGALTLKVEQFGARVLDIDMREFSFSKTYMDAINAKVTQEQLKLGADKKLLTIASEQQQKVAIAEAEATALKAQADGKAYSMLTIAKATADSLRLQAAALMVSKDVLELRRIEVELAKAGRWDGALPQAIYAGAPIPFMNMK